VTDYHDPAGAEESRFRGAPDDVIIVPLVCVTLAANKILRFILSSLIRLLDYASLSQCRLSGFRSSRPRFWEMSSWLS
jgi:hypothetical protein